MNLKEGFAFIIDTNEYAGNFEREMTAFITGVVGECEVGDEYVDQEITEMFDEEIQHASDDNGCYRPCEVYKGDSVAIFFNSKPSDALIETMKSRAYLFNDKRKQLDRWNPESDIKILGFKGIEVSRNNEEISL